MASLASINIRFSADLKQFSTEMENVSREMKRIGSSLQGIGSQLSVGLTLPVLAAGAASIKMASDYEESLNKVNVSFGSSSDAVQNFAKTTLETFGIAEGTALDMAALFGDMATSMGLPQAEAANLSTSLVGLAGDLASFKNIGIEQATTALNGVFTGETESLKLLGIVMTEANLAQFALEKGIQKNIKSFTQAEKVQLRYAYVMEQTKNAQGDFARTSDGAANQTRTLTERFKEIGQQLGAIILPVWNRLLTAVNSLLKGFQQLSPGAKQTIVVFAGIAAAIGPLLLAVGTFVKLIPVMITGFTSLKTSLAAITAINLSATASFTALRSAVSLLTAAIAANPVGILVVGLTSLVAYLAITRKSFQETIQAINSNTSALVEQRKANSDLGSEMGKLLSRYDELKSKQKLSREEQTELNEVIIKIGKIVPSAVTEVNKYGEALSINAAKAREFSQAQKELFELRTKKALEDNITLYKKLEREQKALTINETDLNSKYVEGIGYVRKRNGQLEVFNKLFSTSRDLTLEELILFKEKVALNEQNLKTTLQNIRELKGLKEAEKAVTETVIEAKGRTIALINSEIEAQRKLIDEQTSNSGVVAIQNRIKSLEAERDAILGIKAEREKVNAIELKSSSSSGTIAALEAEITKLKQLRDQAATTTEQIKLIDQAIKNIETQIQIQIDPTSLIQAQTLTTQLATSTSLLGQKAQEMADIMQVVAASVGDAFISIGNRYIESLGLAETGLEGFAKILLQTITKLLSMALANAIVNATQSASSTGPAAAFTQPAFIATAVAGVISAFAAIPKFADGGIVGGSSYYGDKILAAVNSGELILNGKQQRNLMGMMAGAVPQNVNIGVQDILLEGPKLRIILDRTDELNNRKK